jgi:hypothetical protein
MEKQTLCKTAELLFQKTDSNAAVGNKDKQCLNKIGQFKNRRASMDS